MWSDPEEANSAWHPHVPDYVLRLLRSHPDALPIAEGDLADAVVLFADVAGFTPMSEALAGSGRYGTEELSRIMNNWFDTMSGRVAESGGSVVEFQGDALVAVFDHIPEERAVTVRRAVQCALAMQSRMDRFQPVATQAGPFHVEMKVGVGAGPLLQTVMGDADHRLGCVQIGPALERAVAAEHHAEAGEVVVGAALLHAHPGVRLLDRDDGWSVVSGVDGPTAAPRRTAAVHLDHRAATRLAPFLHPAVAERLRSGRRDLVNEHRQVTAVFVGMPSVAADDREAVAALQGYLAAALRLVAQYGGNFRHIAVGDRDSVLVAFFGAPISHEDDQERAVRCSLDLLQLPGGPFRVGVGTGAAYCGEVGTDRRREYAVIGDSVNIAARLMQSAAAGQVLIDQATYTRVHETTAHRRLRPFDVKGKAHPVDVWAVHAIREPTATARQASDAGLMGRDEEIARSRVLVEDARRGAGQVVLLTGEAGVGKSRLAAEIAAIARRRGFLVVGGACRSHAMTMSYLVWRSVWRDLLGLDTSLPIRAQQELLVEQLARHVANPEQRAALLAPVLNLPLPDSELIAPLSPQDRDGLLRLLLLDCLRARSGSTPVLCVIEDAHWIDPASAALLEFLARGIGDRPVLLLVITRGGLDPVTIAASLRTLPHFAELRLAELDPTDAERLVDLRLRRHHPAGAAFDPAVVARIVERGDGNPFYLEELVNYVHATGADVVRPRARVELELPDGLQRLLMARLDQLSEPEQATIKVASVIGRRFRAGWIANAYPAVGGRAEVVRHLERLHELDLTPRRAAGPEPEYEFKHAMTQEVSYQSLTFGMRESLHERCGLMIEEEVGTDRLGQYVDVLAHHYGRSQRTDKQRVWFRAAGDAAKAAFANEAAEDYYDRLIPLLSEDEKADVLVELGGIWHVTGRWADAERVYRQAMEVAGAAGRAETVAASQRELGDLFMYNRSYAEAVLWLRRAAAGFDRLEDRTGLARTLERMTFALYRQGEYAEALATAERHQALAVAAGDAAGMSIALNHIGLVHLDTGRSDEACAYLQRSLDTATGAADRRCLLFAATNLALAHLRRGEHPPALMHSGRAFDVAQEIGFRQMASLVVGNMGEIYRDEGDPVRATRCVAYALRIALELEDWTTVADQVANAAVMAAADPREGRAEHLLGHAVALARHLDAPYMLCGWLHELALRHVEAGRLVAAMRLNQEALDVAEAHDRRDVRVRAGVLAARLQVELGDVGLDDAVAAMRSMADDWSEPEEQALILQNLWELDPTMTAARRAAAERYAELHTRTPIVEYRKAYARLTGSTLPPGPDLPGLPDVLEAEPADLDDLLRRVDEIVPALTAPVPDPTEPSTRVLTATSGRVGGSEPA